MLETIKFTDRYQVASIPYPNSETMCQGHCEGMGVFPVHSGEQDKKLLALWKTAELKSPANDGWHFVKCFECNGTGRKK